MALVLAGLGVNDDDPVMAVAIRNVQLVGRRIDLAVSRPPELRRPVEATVDIVAGRNVGATGPADRQNMSAVALPRGGRKVGPLKGSAC